MLQNYHCHPRFAPEPIAYTYQPKKPPLHIRMPHDASVPMLVLQLRRPQVYDEFPLTCLPEVGLLR